MGYRQAGGFRGTLEIELAGLSDGKSKQDKIKSSDLARLAFAQLLSRRYPKEVSSGSFAQSKACLGK